MGQYRTGQKARLTEFLRADPTRQFTIEGLAAELAPDIGKSTVYRLIHGMVAEGSVRRFPLGTGRGVAYQYLPGAACETHLHMKCVVCGRLLHLDAMVSEFLQKQILATDRFVLDDRLTLLYGRCGRCRATDTPERNEHG